MIGIDRRERERRPATLPQVHEEVEPSFLHTGKLQLPVEEEKGVSARIIAGKFYGQQSPVPTDRNGLDI